MAVSPYTDDPPENMDLSAPLVLTDDPAVPILLRGDELGEEPGGGGELPNTQGLVGIDGSESFEDFALADPVSEALPGNDLGGNLVLMNWTEWWDSPHAAIFTNSKVAIEEYGGRKGMTLNGLRDADTRWGNAATKPTIGPAAAFFPIKNTDLDWTTIRIGALCAYTGTVAPGQGGIRFGLAHGPSPKYEFDFLGMELEFSNLVYNIGKNRWETSQEDLRGRFEHTDSEGAPDYGPANAGNFTNLSSTGYYRWLGEAGVSVFPLIIEIVQNGPYTEYDETNVPPLIGAQAKVVIGASSGTLGVDQATFEIMMKAGVNSISQSGYGYRDIGTLRDQNSEARLWAAYNYIVLESFFPGLWIDLVAYQVLARST